jgi:hypothetical protein
MVDIQPALIRPRQIRVDKISRPEKPLLPSRLPSERERKRPNAEHDVDPKTLEVAAPNVMNVPPADNLAETPSRLNIDELKELVRRDTERQAHAQPGHAVQISKPGGLTAHAGQEALERAWRPKCDNNYKPKIGSVEFSGLMKLPFLLSGALSDNGCK